MHSLLSSIIHHKPLKFNIHIFYSVRLLSFLNIPKRSRSSKRLQLLQLDVVAVTKNSSLPVSQREGEAKSFLLQVMHEYAG